VNTPVGAPWFSRLKDWRRRSDGPQNRRDPMTLTKERIIEKLRDTDLKKSEASRVTESLLEIIKRTLESGEEVLITGFGKFCVKEKKARRGRNPQTGEDLMLRPRRVVTFQCSSILKNEINGKG
jgi:integration host factor subunit alpha